MKTWIAMWGAAVLAAPVLAQADVAALQRAVLIERQEGDLRLAEAEYRKLVAGGDADVRTEAALHLGALLWRLERRDEGRPFLEQAKTAGGAVGARAAAVLDGQDPAGRQAQELAAKVQDIVDRVLRQDQAAIDQLSWLGAAAVPELGRRLAGFRADAVAQLQEARRAGPQGVTDASKRLDAQQELRQWLLVPGPAGGLHAVSAAHRAAGVLWRLGGPEAAAVLRAQLQDPEPDWRRILAAASEDRVHDSLLPVVEELLGDAKADATTQTFAIAAARRLPTERFVRLLQSPHAAVREAAWNSLGSHLGVTHGQGAMWEQAAEPVMAMLAPIVESALAGSNPAEARAAFQFLCGLGAASVRGSEQLLAWLPRVPVFQEPPMPRLQAPLASVVACARQLGRADGSDGKDDRRRFLARIAASASRGKDAASLFLDLVELGYDVLASNSLATDAVRLEPTAADLERLAGLLGRCHAPHNVAAALQDRELPAGAAPLLLARLRQLLEQLPRDQQAFSTAEAVNVFCCIGRTGNPAAAPGLRELHANYPEWDAHVGEAMLRLAERSTDDAVSAFLRELLVLPSLSPELRNEVFRAVVARADAAAIPLFAKAYELGLGSTSVTRRSRSAVQSNTAYRGVGWLGAEPKGPFTAAQQLAIWQSLLQSTAWSAVLIDTPIHSDLVPDAVCLLTVETVVARMPEFRKESEDWEAPEWLQRQTRGLARRLPLGDDADAQRYRAAILALCADPSLGPPLLQELRDGRAIAQLADALVPLMRSDNWYWVYETLQVHGGVAVPTADIVACLRSSSGMRARLLEILPREAAPEVVAQVEALVADSGVDVRLEACKTLGRFLSASSAPALLQALRDANEDVRQAATAALNQIRLYHEQKAFWDQFQTGIVTGRDAAVAKLLTQAKPGEPKDRRVLALWSLGELGSIEALPYLIDWKDDDDPELAAAILQAIGRIQQNTKR